MTKWVSTMVIVGFSIMAISYLIISFIPGQQVVKPIHISCSHTEFSDDDYQSAALKILMDRDEFIEHSLQRETQEHIDSLKAKAVSLTPWANSLPDPCMRYYIKNWLEFIPRQAQEKFDEFTKNGGNPDPYEEEQRQRRLRIDSLLEKENLK